MPAPARDRRQSRTRSPLAAAERTGGVAREFARGRYQLDGIPDAASLARRLVAVGASHWVEVEQRAVRAEAYEFTEHAVFDEGRQGRAVVAEPAQGRRLARGARRDHPSAGDACTSPAGSTATTTARSWRARTGCSTWNSANCSRTRRVLQPDRRAVRLRPGGRGAGTWLQFLNELWEEDDASINALQECFGYVISGRLDLHKILLLVGPTRAGKGVIARTLTALVGADNVAGPTLSSLAGDFGLAPLLGKPLAIVSDARMAGRGSQVVVERLLAISGEDTITVNRKYRDQWTGKLPSRFVVISNELPQLGDASQAIAGRFVTLLLTKSWYGKEDTTLESRIRDELTGILNWALGGLDRLSCADSSRGRRRPTRPTSRCRTSRRRSARSSATAARSTSATRSPSTTCGPRGSPGPRTTATPSATSNASAATCAPCTHASGWRICATARSARGCIAASS